MKQSLQLRLGQSLTMTPQLQQAIRLLQLSTLELRTEIQQALETNPMLDLEDEFDLDQDSELDDETGQEESPEEESYDDPEDELAESSDELPDELPVDSAWEDIYEPSLPAASGAGPDDDRPLEFGDQSSESLREHLLWQLRMTALLERDIAIGEALIDAIDDDGFLTMSVDELAAGFPPEWELETDEVTAVLHVVQNFDPPGVGARDLKESLWLQLRQLDLELPWRTEAQDLVDRHFDLLANRDYTTLKRRMKLEDDDLIAVVKLIQSLNPRPGGQVSNSRPEYVVPDVVVRKERGAWRVELNPDAAPRLRINTHYANLIKQVQDSSDSTYMKNHLQEARWFLKSLQSRNETLLKVASAIVERQQGFLEHGEVAMKALVLADIAEAVGMHESTISRVTTRKYLHTPRGVFELKYFFSSHVSTSGGGECSSTAIRALIKQLVAEENPAKPLSDSKLAAVLSEQGINVARRTVAKYREAMAIPPSNERKRLA